MSLGVAGRGGGRYTMRWVAAVAAVVAMLAAPIGCAPQQARVPQAAAAPSGPMAAVHQGMDPAQVQRLLGAPTSVRPFITGKAFIPWYFGPDRTRTAFYYKGQGRVIFSGDPVNANSRVVEVQYDPSEPGSPR
jgi:hypothetical protein